MREIASNKIGKSRENSGNHRENSGNNVRIKSLDACICHKRVKSDQSPVRKNSDGISGNHRKSHRKSRAIYETFLSKLVSGPILKFAPHY